MILPHAYFDTDIFQQELEKLFRHTPGYVGHEKIVPNIGDFYTLKQEQNARTLIHNSEGVSLISNICRHRQAVMYEGSGHTKAITCPLHKWTWNLRGEMQGAPHFEQNPCLHLRNSPLQNWRGLLFDGKRDIAKDLRDVGYTEEICFDAYRYHRTEYHECHYNWKTFMEVYGDDYHVVPFHPGLSKMVSMKDLTIETGEHWHVQRVGKTEILDAKVTPIYASWREKCLTQGDGTLPKDGAIWLAYYPNIMVEVYPYTLTVSTLHPISPEKTLNVIEYFYHSDVDDALIEAEQAAYMETAIEDDIIAERIDQGRRILMDQAASGSISADELAGPYHETLERGTRHFHEWYAREMGK